jgi:hypothetical protein
MIEVGNELFCQNCKNSYDPLWFFCPTCGKKIKEKPAGMGVWNILGLFTLSALLPPLNIGLSIKYIKDPNQKAKMWGWISIGVMILALVLATLWSIKTVNDINRQVETEMGKYLGF